MTEIVLLDGGMGQELIARSRHPLHPLWSTHVMLQEPEIVRDVHLDYIEAGATGITVNAYSATPQRLAREGIPEKFDELQAIACRLAHEARDEAGEDVAVLGCLPPLVGSYVPDQALHYEESLDSYRRIAACQAAHVDLFLAETMPSAGEGRAAVEAASETGKPVWVSWTLKDGGDPRLRSGETLAEAIAALDGLPVAAYLVNCCHPESIDAAMPQLAQLPRPVGAYANAFHAVEGLLVPGGTVSRLSARDDLDPARYGDFAMGWIGQGARIVGGCCEVGPAHIAALATRLTGAGHSVVRPPC